MSLKEQQDVLARLYTDPNFAAQFFAEPSSVIANSGLSREEAREMAASAGDEIKLFADSLISKRLREIEKLLPITTKILGSDFGNLFRDHAATFNPISVKKHLEDALEFGAFVRQNNSFDLLTQDLILFEMAKLRHFSNGRRLTVCSLRHDIRPILDGQVADLPRQRRTLVIWLRITEKHRFFFI